MLDLVASAEQLDAPTPRSRQLSVAARLGQEKHADVVTELGADPNLDTPLSFLFGAAHLANGRPDEGKHVFSIMVNAGSDDVRSQLLLASAHVLLSDGDGAKEVLDRTLALDPLAPRDRDEAEGPPRTALEITRTRLSALRKEVVDRALVDLCIGALSFYLDDTEMASKYLTTASDAAGAHPLAPILETYVVNDRRRSNKLLERIQAAAPSVSGHLAKARSRDSRAYDDALALDANLVLAKIEKAATIRNKDEAREALRGLHASHPNSKRVRAELYKRRR